MRTPSIRTLSEVFDDPKAAKKVLRMTRAQMLATAAGRARGRQCYNSPSTADICMHVLDSLDPGLFGVESIEMVNGEYADYLNTGDSYAGTVILWRGNYRVQSVGDFVETMERNGLHAR